LAPPDKPLEAIVGPFGNRFYILDVGLTLSGSTKILLTCCSVGVRLDPSGFCADIATRFS